VQLSRAGVTQRGAAQAGAMRRGAWHARSHLCTWGRAACWHRACSPQGRGGLFVWDGAFGESSGSRVGWRAPLVAGPAIAKGPAGLPARLEKPARRRPGHATHPAVSSPP
jgi:hypothetical protein